MFPTYPIFLHPPGRQHFSALIKVRIRQFHIEKWNSQYITQKTDTFRGQNTYVRSLGYWLITDLLLALIIVLFIYKSQCPVAEV